MRQANVFVAGNFAGVFTEDSPGKSYRFDYQADYTGSPVSLTMPTSQRTWAFDRFPPYFEGVLPEGTMLEGLLRGLKIDRDDLFSQLLATGEDLVGAVTVKPLEP